METVYKMPAVHTSFVWLEVVFGFDPSGLLI